MENSLLPKEAVIQEKRQETSDTWTLSLSFKEDTVQQHYHFSPGQFNMVGLWGIGEVPLSLSSPPGDGTFLHTIRAVGEVTRALTACRIGDRVGVRGPYGNPWPMEAMQDHDLLIVAGGIGLAPLRPVIEEWLSFFAPSPRGTRCSQSGMQRVDGEGLGGGELSGRKMTILYGARTPTDLLFGSDFSRWQEHHGTRIRLTVDRTDADWPYQTGAVTSLLREVPLDPMETTVFLCGPEIMMRLSALELRKRGIAPARIYVSVERNMKCALGQCGHCLFGPVFVCKDGPVFRLDRLKKLWGWGM